MSGVVNRLTVREVDLARQDPVVFADLLLQQPLWPHQQQVVRSPARYRVLCAGRRSGKTRTYGVLALHCAFSRPGRKVFIVSASETSAKRMFADLRAMLTDAPGLTGSVADENQHVVTLSNGSSVECVPSSMKAVRSAEADLLIIDEAGFVEQEIWEAAEPLVLARPGARVLIGSTPWRGPGHFFHDLWQQGMTRPDSEVESWHWPSTVSPLVNETLLESIKARSATDYFEREYLAAWTDDAGSYFSESEIMANVASYDLLAPEDAPEAGGRFDGVDFFRSLPAVLGVDWGQARDANAVVALAPLEDYGLNAETLGRDRAAVFIPWLEARYRWPWAEFIDRIVEIVKSYKVLVVASETNGVGAYPTDDLAERIFRQVGGGISVAPVWTDVRRKQSGFGKLKAMLQHHQLVLPNHPELLKQLRALEFEQLQSGSMRIAVPERAGHDDLAMALMQAVSCVLPERLRVYREGSGLAGRRHLQRHLADVELLHTQAGVVVPRRALPSVQACSWQFLPEGGEQGEGW